MQIKKRCTHIIAILTLILAVIPQEAKAFNEFDYPAGGSRKAVGISTDVIAIGLPITALSIICAKRDWNGLLQASLETVGVVGTTYLLKKITNVERPDHSDNNSFPSMHASVSFLTASFMMRRYGWKFGVPAYALATYVSWGRMYSKKHHFWDVAAGAAIGTAAGLLFTTPYMKKYNVTIEPGLLSTPTLDPHSSPNLDFTLTARLTF